MEEQAVQNVRYVGINIERGAWEAAFLDGRGAVRTYKGMANAKGRQALYRMLRAQDTVALAAKKNAFAAAKEMEIAAGCRVYVPDAVSLGFAEESDVAVTLARMVRDLGAGGLPAAAPPDEEELLRRKLRASWQTEKLNRSLTLKRLHGLFVASGIRTTLKKDLYTAERRREAIGRLKGFERREAEHLLDCLRLYEEWTETLELRMNAGE